MSSKLGLILSTIYVALFFLFGTDLLCIQYAYSELDAKSVNISYLISREGVITDTFVNYIESTYNINFQCLSNCTPLFGDTVEYKVTVDYQPLVISSTPMTLSIKRTTVIGFFG